MHIDDDLLDKVFNSHFKNTFETGSSGCYCGPSLNADGSIKQTHSRLSVAHHLFGLGERYQPSLVTDPKAFSYDNMDERKLPKKGTDPSDMVDFRRNKISTYLELQFHGDVTIDCVESLTFPYDLTDQAKSKYLNYAKN